jgi:hypothetical protein
MRRRGREAVRGGSPLPACGTRGGPLLLPFEFDNYFASVVVGGIDSPGGSLTQG